MYQLSVDDGNEFGSSDVHTGDDEKISIGMWPTPLEGPKGGCHAELGTINQKVNFINH